MTDANTNAPTPSSTFDLSTLTTWQGFLTALKRLVSSMKFWTFMLTLLLALGTKYGFNVDPTAYWTIVGLGAALLGVQGATDWGKNAQVAQNQSHAIHSAKYGTPFSSQAAVAQFAPAEAKLLIIGDDGKVSIHMTDGTDHDITEMLSKAGFVKSALVRPGQAGFARLALMQLIAVVAVIAIALSACLSGAQAKEGGLAAGGCGISDLVKYADDVKTALGTEGFTSALGDVAKKDGLAQEALVCLVQGVLAVESGGGSQTANHGQETPVVSHARAFLAAQKK